jgi:ABC-type transporter Mla maintaining outer membrane lipid asymmetry ATPase subunit MlaF
VPSPAIELTGLVKDCRGLRPLRIQALAVAEGEIVALGGPDIAAAEVLTNLLTGATLPDAGSVRIFGRGTASVEDASDWLTFIDQFGIISERVVLLDMFTVEQNVAVPLTLDLDPLDPAVRESARRLAADAGIRAQDLAASMPAAAPLLRARVRLARALALQPRMLILEHPTVGLPRPDVAPLARAVARVARARRLTAVALTGDKAFARALTGRALTLDLATGAVRRQEFLRRIFGRQRSS